MLFDPSTSRNRLQIYSCMYAQLYLQKCALLVTTKQCQYPSMGAGELCVSCFLRGVYVLVYVQNTGWMHKNLLTVVSSKMIGNSGVNSRRYFHIFVSV